MSNSIYLAIAVAIVGAVVAAYTIKRAPPSEEFSLWDFAMMGGLCAVPLGLLGALVDLMTRAH